VTCHYIGPISSGWLTSSYDSIGLQLCHVGIQLDRKLGLRFILVRTRLKMLARRRPLLPTPIATSAASIIAIISIIARPAPAAWALVCGRESELARLPVEAMRPRRSRWRIPSDASSHSQSCESRLTRSAVQSPIPAHPDNVFDS